MSNLHCSALLAFAFNDTSVQLLDAFKQMHTSYLIEQAPALTELQLITRIAELLMAAASILDGVSGAN